MAIIAVGDIIIVAEDLSDDGFLCEKSETTPITEKNSSWVGWLELCAWNKSCDRRCLGEKDGEIMGSFGETEASPPTGDPGADLVDAVLQQTPAHSSVPLLREPTLGSPLMRSHLSPRQNSQRNESDDELIEKGHVFVDEMIGEIVKRDSSSMRRCRDWAGSLTADDLREYGVSPGDSRGAIAFMHFARWTSENMESELNVGTIPKPSHVTMRSKLRKSHKYMPNRLGSMSEDGSVRSRESQHASESSRSSKSKGRRREGRRSTKQRGESENAPRRTGTFCQ